MHIADPRLGSLHASAGINRRTSQNGLWKYYSCTRRERRSWKRRFHSDHQNAGKQKDAAPFAVGYNQRIPHGFTSKCLHQFLGFLPQPRFPIFTSQRRLEDGTNALRFLSFWYWHGRRSWHDRIDSRPLRPQGVPLMPVSQQYIFLSSPHRPEWATHLQLVGLSQHVWTGLAWQHHLVLPQHGPRFRIWE